VRIPCLPIPAHLASCSSPELLIPGSSWAISFQALSNLCPSFEIKGHVSHPHRTTGEIKFYVPWYIRIQSGKVYQIMQMAILLDAATCVTKHCASSCNIRSIIRREEKFPYNLFFFFFVLPSIPSLKERIIIKFSKVWYFWRNMMSQDLKLRRSAPVTGSQVLHKWQRITSKMTPCCGPNATVD